MKKNFFLCLKKFKTLKNSIFSFIETHKFDGIEIDWKWPAGPSGSPNDKQNFATLLKVI